MPTRELYFPTAEEAGHSVPLDLIRGRRTQAAISRPALSTYTVYAPFLERDLMRPSKLLGSLEPKAIRRAISAQRAMKRSQLGQNASKLA